MHNDKRLSKEDTWRPADLRKYMREDLSSNVNMRKTEEREQRPRGSKSTERHKRDPEDSKQEREKLRERHDVDRKDRYAEHQREVSRDRRKEKERGRRGEDKERRHASEMDVERHSVYKEHRRKEETHERERHRGKERDRTNERQYEGDQSRRREERDKERRREERDREHRPEGRKHEGRNEGGQDRSEKHHKKERDRERDRKKDEYEKRRSEKEREIRHREAKEERRRSERSEKEKHKEEHREHKEEQGRTSKDRRHHQDEEKHDYKSKEYKEAKASSEVRRHGSHKEPSERDKLKERRPREDKEEQQKQSSSSQLKPESEATKTTVDKEEDLNTREYEDDFEDYEEDFEEMDESESEEEEEREEETEQPTAQISKEIQMIQRAMDEENKQVTRSNSTQRVDHEQLETQQVTDFRRKDSQRGKFIDFVAAKQREINKMVASNQKKRSTELLRLIDLDFSRSFSHLDLPPVNEYDMYIRSFGSANTRQAYVQTNEDNAERDIQTEEIEVSEKWTQHPAEHSGACGDPNLTSGDKTVSEMKFDTQSLTAFLRSAAQVVVVLLEEDQAEQKSLKKTSANLLSFSDAGLQLNTHLPFLHGRPVSLVHFSTDQRHTMLSVHEPTSRHGSVGLDCSTVICIWNIWEPSRPQKVLVYESQVQCCCFSPGKASLVFAGTSVGSVALWDLREHVGYHRRQKIGEDEWTFRQPTFCTDAVMASAAHFSSVTSVEVVPAAAAAGPGPKVQLLASEEESADLSLQLASLDESGVLNFWVVLQLPVTNEAGSQTDLGLRPGGKVKLLHSSSRQTSASASAWDAGKTGAASLQLKFLPTDSNHFFISTNMGLVTHGTIHGIKASPRKFGFMDLDDRPVDVTAVDFSPFRSHLFLIGCGDGSIRLHTVRQEQPLSEWKSGKSGEAVVALQWSHTKSTVFCVLDAASNLYVWDLMRSDAEPVVTERISTDRVTAMSVYGDSLQQNLYSGIALAHKSGKIELHYFTKTFSGPSEEGELDRIMKEAL